LQPLSEDEKNAFLQMQVIESRIQATANELQAAILLRDDKEIEALREKIVTLFECKVDQQIVVWKTIRSKL
jgi:hypothetical protein